MVSDEIITQKLSMLAAQGCCRTVLAFMRLQFKYGLRISDMLKIQRYDISAGLRLCVRQSKGSESLILDLSYDMDFWSEYRMGMHTDISLFNRFYFYRLYKRLGLQELSGGGVNYSVTHSARRSVVQDVYAVSGSIDAAAAAVGHKSTLSTEHYLSPDQRKRNMGKGILDQPIADVSHIRVRKNLYSTIIYLKK